VEGSNPIGEYLRARRELLRPEDVGLPDSGRRRVPGLRRAELATLAGISTDYYMRLEQGRDQHPSEPVVDGLARALQLDEEANDYLHELARPRPRRRPPHHRAETVPTGIQQLIACWSHTPAYVLNRRLDVLASNPAGSGGVPGLHTRRQSPARHVPGPAVSKEARLGQDRGRHGGWAPRSGRPRRRGSGLAELVDELSIKSERFRSLWARHDVRAGAVGTARFDHPEVGQLELSWEKLDIPGVEQSVIIFYAEPASPSEQALARLADMT